MFLYRVKTVTNHRMNVVRVENKAGTLKRCNKGQSNDEGNGVNYNFEGTITQSALVVAMTKRWGRAYNCSLQLDKQGYVAVAFQGQGDYLAGAACNALVMDMLNTHGIGSHFIEYIQYDANVKNPQHDSTYIVSLGIPTSGPRFAEWNG